MEKAVFDDGHGVAAGCNCRVYGSPVGLVISECFTCRESSRQSNQQSSRQFN